MILVFDLDDTLYDELSYVRSGFRVVARHIEECHGIASDKVFDLCNRQLQRGRTGIFDVVLRQLGMYSKSLVRRCIGMYRLHQPEISLFPEAVQCLARFQRYPLYIVTDGNCNAQKNKLVALGLYNAPPVRHCFLTYRYGHRHGKPSPYCFLKIVDREGAIPADVVYIADNPNKDFVGIKPLGFRTIRVLTGQHRAVRKEPAYEAEHQIPSLSMLTEAYLHSVGMMATTQGDWGTSQ